MNRRTFVRTRGVRYLSCCLVALFLLLTARGAFAADPERVEWSADWPRFRKAEIALTSGMALQMAWAKFVYPEARIRWEGGILFDDAARNALVLGTRASRDQAGEVERYHLLLSRGVSVRRRYGDRDGGHPRRGRRGGPDARDQSRGVRFCRSRGARRREGGSRASHDAGVPKGPELQ